MAENISYEEFIPGEKAVVRIYRALRINVHGIDRGETWGKCMACSIRCVKD